MRSTMGQERLNALSMLYCHTDIDISPEEIVDQFAQCHTRCMLQVNPLDYHYLKNEYLLICRSSCGGYLCPSFDKSCIRPCTRQWLEVRGPAGSRSRAYKFAYYYTQPSLYP